MQSSNLRAASAARKLDSSARGSYTSCSAEEIIAFMVCVSDALPPPPPPRAGEAVEDDMDWYIDGDDTDERAVPRHLARDGVNDDARRCERSCALRLEAPLACERDSDLRDVGAATSRTYSAR